MAFIFPTSPNIGDLVTNPNSGQIFRWDGTAWGGTPAQALLTASFAFTASYVIGGGVSVSASYADTASYALYAVSASYEIVHELSSSYAETASYVKNSDSASYFQTSSVTSASLSQTASYVENAQTASYVESSSYSNNSDTASIAKTIDILDGGGVNLSYVNFSNVIATGGVTVLGTDALRYQQSTATLFARNITGSLHGTASWANNAISASYALTASYVENIKDVGFQKEWHVSAESGSDITGNGSLSKPFATVGKAFSVLGGSGQQVVIHPGTYVESPLTLIQPNVTIVGSNNNMGGICYINGNVTIAGMSSSTRISGIAFENLTHSGSSGLYMDSIQVKSNYNKVGTGYAEIINSDLQATGSVVFRGGTTVIQGDKVFAPVVSGSGTALYIKDSLSCLSPSAIAGGILAIDNSQIYPVASGSAAITSAAGTVVYLYNSQITTVTGVPERINIGGFLGYDDIQFNKSLSTLGTPLNTKAHFQSLDVNSFGATGSLFGTASWSSRSGQADLAGLYTIQYRTNNQDYAIAFTTAGSTGYMNVYTDSDQSSSFNPGTNRLTIPQLNVTGGITGSLIGTASWANNVVSASYAATASILLGSVQSASYAATASYLSNPDIVVQNLTGTVLTENTITVIGAYGPGLTEYYNDRAKWGIQSTFNLNNTLVTASIPNLIFAPINMFASCSAVTKVSQTQQNCVYIPSATELGQQVFANCGGLVSASLPNVIRLGSSQFSNCTSLQYVSLPGLSGSTALGSATGSNSVFNNVPNTGYIELPLFYSSSAGSGRPDGDITYLTTSPRAWTINWL